MEGQVFQPLDDGVSQELVDGHAVILYPFFQGTAADACALVSVFGRCFAGYPLEGLQDFCPSQHFLDGVGTQKIEVNIVQPLGVSPFVPLGPFLGIADGAYASQIDCRHEVGLVCLLNQVGERQVGRVGMADVAPHDEGESPDFGWPENVGITGGLGTPFNDALVDGAQFVEMVALVGATPRVEEGEHARDEQAGLVHGDSIRTGEYGACLPVFPLAVAEEQGVVGGEKVPEVACLPDEAADEGGTVGKGGAGSHDEVFCHDVAADVGRGGGIAVDGAVFQT